MVEEKEPFKALKNLYSDVGLNILILVNSSNTGILRTKDLFELYGEVFGAISRISFFVALENLRERGWVRRSKREWKCVEWEANPAGLKHIALLKKMRAARKAKDHPKVVFLNRYFREIALKKD